MLRNRLEYFESIVVVLDEGPHEIIAQVFVQHRRAVVIDQDEWQKSSQSAKKSMDANTRDLVFG